MAITRRYIGLSSGSSRNGVDAALVRVEGIGMEAKLHLEHFCEIGFARELRQLLARIELGQETSRALGVAHRVLGEAFAGAARQVLDETRANPAHVMAVGCDGHVAWHGPEG